MNAVISGRAGLALLIEGESLMSLDVDDLETLVPRSHHDLRFLLADATDLVTLENTDRANIAERLDLEHDIACALDMTLIALDPDASMELRAEAIAALEELLAAARVIERLEFTMYAKPLPESADLIGALFCTEVKTAAARLFFERLAQSQPAISAVREAWDALPDRLFGGDPSPKALFHDAVCREGLFRLLALSYGDQAKVSTFLREALENGSISNLRNHREVVQRWCAPIRDAGRADAPALKAGRFDEEALLPKAKNRRTSIGNWLPHATIMARTKRAVIPRMAYWIVAAGIICSAALGVYQGLISVQAGIKLTPLPIEPGQLSQLIAVDYQETSDSLIVSLNRANQKGYNFVRVSRSGVITQFSIVSDLPEEVCIAVAPSQNSSGKGLSLGGFTVGDVFAGSGFGTGAGATIARISADGTTVQDPFATLPGETGLPSGGLYFDRTGNFGGDLIVGTTSGGVYRVKSTGVATLVARLQGNNAIEGIITLPNDPRFGPLSGKILVGCTDIGLRHAENTNILAVDPIEALHPMGTFTAFVPFPPIVRPTLFRIVPADGDFFGADFITQKVFTAPARQFSDIVGDLVIVERFDPNTKTSKLFDVVWDPINNNLKTTEIVGGRVGKYKDITFS